MYETRFESIGMYVPEQSVSTGELIDQMENKPEFDLVELTGIKNRRHRVDGESTISISINAMKDCLANSRYTAEDLDIIIACSISRLDGGQSFIWEPPMALLLKEAVGAKNAKFFTISNACAGMGTGVHILNNMLRSGAVKNGMVLSGESITCIADTAVKESKGPVDLQFGSLTVGDAGSAVIMDTEVDGDEGIKFTHFVTMADFSDMCFGLPSEHSAGYAMYSDAFGIHRESILRLPPFTRGTRLRREGVDTFDYEIDWYVPHQTSTRAMNHGLKAMSEYFDIAADYCKKRLVSKYIEDFGNTGSTSHFVIFYQALKDGMFKKGDTVYFQFLASGIVLGGIHFKIGEMQLNGCKKTAC
jgi:3-oxoacyl-[acyl-carrier-protein] synthase-3